MIANITQNPSSRPIVAKHLPTLLKASLMWKLYAPAVHDQEERYLLGQARGVSESRNFLALCIFSCLRFTMISATGAFGVHGRTRLRLAEQLISAPTVLPVVAIGHSTA